MGIEEIAELILLLLFFVISPLIQRRRAQKQRENAPVPPPPGDVPGAPAPRAPLPPRPATASDYAEYLATGLLEYRTQALRLKKELEASPLHQLPELSALANSLQERANAEIGSTVDAIDTVVDSTNGSPRAQAADLSRVTETVRDRVGQTRVYASLYSTIAEQRLSPGRRQRFMLLDKLLERLTSQGRSAAKPRRRWALAWDRDPAIPSSLIGPGGFGLSAVNQSRLGMASGWTDLARGVGFDLLAQFPNLTNELKQAAMVGPLADRPVATYDYAQTSFDLSAALGAWIPNLTADVVGAILLGHAYARGVVHSEISRGIRTSDVAAIQTEGGRYHFEPPLMVRLAVIDEVLIEIGWSDGSNGMGSLKQRIQLPTEGTYVMPNRMTRRLILQPLLDFMRKVAEALIGTRFSAASDQLLDEITGGRLPAILKNKIEIAHRSFLSDKRPEGDPVVLLCGAILAETDPAANGHSYESALIRALTEKRVRRSRKPSRMRTSDRVLLRDALVLSEIL